MIMKYLYLSLLCTLGMLTSCTTPETFNLKGTVDIPECSKLYLYEVSDEFYQNMNLIDTIVVENGLFVYKNDSLGTNLYCLSTQDYKKEYLEDFAYMLLEPVVSKVTISKVGGKFKVNVESSSLTRKYEKFNEDKKKVGNREVLDSLDNLFFAAREKGNREEMARIKEASEPYYEKTREDVNNFISKSIDENDGTLFGLFLYYSNRFQHNTFGTIEEINTIKDKLAKYDENTKSSIFYNKIQESLLNFEKCAVGHEAPEITGVDTLGNAVSLKDFRGKYVLVDFWSSGCGWCRKETPNLLKAYNDCKDKNFTILGVSSDYKREDWVNAINEDKSYWDQILLKKEDIKSTLDRYCIIGIPHIILVDPNGVIVAKELRGEDIINTVSKFVSQQN